MSGKVGLRQQITTTGWRSRTNVAMTSTSASVPAATQPSVQPKAVVGHSGPAEWLLHRPSGHPTV